MLRKESLMFKPILAPNEEINLDEIKYPLLASTKLDGIRCIFYKGEMLSRSLKPIVNKQLRKKFTVLADYTREKNLILDGEIYSHELSFQEITSYVMTQDFEDKKSIKKFNRILTIPESLKFNCFDCLKIENDKIYTEIPFSIRCEFCNKIVDKFSNIMTVLKQVKVNSANEVKNLFEKVLTEDYEGLILRSAEGQYKFGRCTIKEANIYKVKPFRTFDGKIIEVTQGTEVNPEAEKKINELGYSVTSNKKDDRMLVDRVRDFVVEYENTTVKVSSCSLTHEERKELWKKRNELIGQYIEYKGLLIGSKFVPRHPIFVRWRKDKNE